MNNENLGPAPELEPCPFCGKPLAVKWRRNNPSARCITEECWGAKMPSLQLDVPEFVAAWNRRDGRGLKLSADSMEVP
jgi:hypothetical protein